MEARTLRVLALATLAVLLVGCVNNPQTPKSQNSTTNINIIITPAPAQTTAEDQIISDNSPSETISNTTSPNETKT